MCDDSGRLTGFTVNEPEWDDTERDWMLALADYEESLCPGCGLPVDLCRAGENGLSHDARICWGSAHRKIASKQWADDHPKSLFADCLITSITQKT